jgi:hypothetical protein
MTYLRIFFRNKRYSRLEWQKLRIGTYMFKLRQHCSEMWTARHLYSGTTYQTKSVTSQTYLRIYEIRRYFIVVCTEIRHITCQNNDWQITPYKRTDGYLSDKLLHRNVTTKSHNVTAPVFSILKCIKCVTFK